MTSAKTLLLLGIVIREAFSFWTGHPYDFEVWVRTGYWVVRGVNPYGIVPSAPGVSFVSDVTAGGTATLAYLPFWPALLGGVYEVYNLLGSPSPFLYYFLLKQPIIVCDVLAGYLLYRYLVERGSEKAQFALKVWLFSPLGVIISGIWGMFDAIAVFFLMIALTVRSGRHRAFWAGMATFAKSIPLIYTLPLVWRGHRKPVNLAVAIMVPILASVLVIMLAGWDLSVFTHTMQSTLGKGGRTLSIWDLLFFFNYVGAVSDSQLVALAWVGYVWIAAVALATVLAYRWFGFDSDAGIVRSLLLITATFLVLRAQVNEQYLLYILVFALIDVAMWSPQRKRLVWALLAVGTAEILTNDLLLIRMLAPVYPQAVGLEVQIIASIDVLRRTLMFLEAMVLCAVEIYYVYLMRRERHAPSLGWDLERRVSYVVLARRFSKIATRAAASLATGTRNGDAET